MRVLPGMTIWLAMLATSALAEPRGLSLNGDARMGIIWTDSDRLGPRESGLQLSSRARLHLKFRGETDGGLQFGADLTLDENRNRPKGGVVTIGR